MENVPVKISEKYKPPPRIYQLPQSIANKLLMAPDHYSTAPQYTYDFQLEHKVSTKAPQWRRYRQLEKDRRCERKEKREMQRLREAEAQQKQLLGAVSYPSAEELSSSDDESGQKSEKAFVLAHAPATTTASPQPCNFHDILQPTILRPQKTGGAADNSQFPSLGQPSNQMSIALKWTSKDKTLTSSAFNYEDFENDTSSPFDNIELKTINDLDILAQCLHNTQLTKPTEPAERTEEKVIEEEKSNESDTTPVEREQDEEVRETNVKNTQENVDVASNPSEVVESTKAALQKVDFGGLTEELPENANIPTATVETGNNFYYHYNGHHQPHQHYTQPQQNSSFFSHYNTQQYNAMQQQQQKHLPHQFVSQNQNGPLYSPNSNGGGVSTNAYYVTTQYQQYPTCVYGNNATTTQTPSTIAAPKTYLQSFTDYTNARAKSVPDILRELSDEVHNSAIRRTRNISYNLNDDVKMQNEQTEDNGGQTKEGQQTLNVSASNETATSTHASSASAYYSKLEAPTQKLAKYISSMGFPLERVARIAQIYGADDKKIIEHLIPLSELMDLGFDETKISEALTKFDNNKDKALDHLIS